MYVGVELRKLDVAKSNESGEKLVLQLEYFKCVLSSSDVACCMESDIGSIGAAIYACKALI